MPSRGIKASKELLEEAEKKLSNKGWSQEELSRQVGVTRQTVNNFFNGKPIEKSTHHKICSELELTENTKEVTNTTQVFDIDALVQDIRQKVSKNIKKTCGTMRVLDMTQPIDLGSIYTQVNILEKITARTRVELHHLLESLNTEEGQENFYRLGLSGIKEKRVEGLKAVQDNDKLMVLGKPGSGKTTFLKYLAIQCNKGDFLKSHVPVFIPLKQFAETEVEEDKPLLGLLDYISQQLDDCGVIENQPKAEQLLKAGRAFVLLDGLDEVREQDSDKPSACASRSHHQRNS